MKLMLVLFLPIFTHAQPFAAMALSPTSAEIQAGYLYRGYESTLLYRSAFYQAYLPSILAVSVGAKIKVDEYYLTPSIGVARYRISTYDKEGEPMPEIAILPSFRFEVGKDYNIGSAFVLAGFCRKLYAEIGIKCYIK